MPMPSFTRHTLEAGRELASHRTELKEVPEIGRALLAAVLRKLLPDLFRDVADHARPHLGTKPGNEVRYDLAKRLLVAGIAEALLPDLQPSAPRRVWDAKPLAARDLRSAARLMAAWALQDENLVRRIAEDRAPRGPRSRKTKGGATYDRRGIAAMLVTYRAVRMGTTAPEQNNQNPFVAVAHAIGDELKLAGKAGDASVALAKAWKTTGAFFIGLPRESRLAIFLSHLIALDPSHDPRAHALSDEIESIIGQAVVHARLRALRGLTRRAAGRELLATQVLQAVVEDVRWDSLGWLRTASLSGPIKRRRTIEVAIEARTKQVLPALTRVVDLRDIESSVAAARLALGRAVHRALKAAGADKATTTNIRRVLANASQRSFLARVLDRLTILSGNPALGPDAAVDKHWDDVGRCALDELAARFAPSETWEVAVPIVGWRTTDTTKLGRPLASVREVERAWKSSYFGVPLATDALCTVVAGIRAPNGKAARDTAVAIAKGRIDTAWFATNAMSALDVHDDVLTRRDGVSVGRHMQRRSELARTAPVRVKDVALANDALTQLQRRMASKKFRATMQRIVDAIFFYQRSMAASVLHERYANLWFCLETLFGNLETDLHAPPVAIGSRVAYRCAMLWHPGSLFVGRTWGESRWAIALELQGLYALRNAAVHEGELRPVSDLVLLQRVRSIVRSALEIVLGVALSKGLGSIEELLAWCEHHYPPTAKVP